MFKHCSSNRIMHLSVRKYSPKCLNFLLALSCYVFLRIDFIPRLTVAISPYTCNACFRWPFPSRFHSLNWTSLTSKISINWYFVVTESHTSQLDWPSTKHTVSNLFSSIVDMPCLLFLRRRYYHGPYRKTNRSSPYFVRRWRGPVASASVIPCRSVDLYPSSTELHRTLHHKC